jgi:host factor-I protein
MSKSQPNLQDMFLNQVRKENATVTIYLTNGVQLRGIVRGFDSFTVLLESPGRPTQIVYKHAMTSIVPMRPVSGFTGDARREAHPSKQPAEPAAAPTPAPAPPAPEPEQG